MVTSKDTLNMEATVIIPDIIMRHLFFPSKIDIIYTFTKRKRKKKNIYNICNPFNKAFCFSDFK